MELINKEELIEDICRYVAELVYWEEYPQNNHAEHIIGMVLDHVSRTE